MTTLSELYRAIIITYWDYFIIIHSKVILWHK